MISLTNQEKRTIYLRTGVTIVDKKNSQDAQSSPIKPPFLLGEHATKPLMSMFPPLKPLQVDGTATGKFSLATAAGGIFMPPQSPAVAPLLLAVPPAIEAAEGLLELVTLPAKKFGVRGSMRRRFAKQSLELVAQCGECWHSPKHEARRQMVIGNANRLLKRYHTATIAFRLATKHRPNRSDALVSLAWCQKRTDQLSDAIASLTRALSLAPESAKLHYKLSSYLAEAGQIRAAIYELAFAIEIDPKCRRRAIASPDFDALRLHPAFFALTAARSVAK